MIILALDLGSPATKTAATILDTDSGVIQRTSFATTPEQFLRHLELYHPKRVVLECTRGSGWVVDLLRGAGVAEVQIANAKDPAWLNRTSKTDGRDADLLARLSATGQLRTVHIPERAVREWRTLIDFRHRLVGARTRVKNHIKAILQQQGIATGKLWNSFGMTSLRLLAKPLAACEVDELWRGELAMDLARLREADLHVQAATERLDRLLDACPAAQDLLTVDGVGPRTVEAIIATIDNPLRFANQKDIGAYTGLVPRVLQSGSYLRHGRVTKAGDRILRAMLIQAVRVGVRRTEWMRTIYTTCRRDDPGRDKRAVVAVARRVAVRLWAKFRDYRRKNPQEPLLSPAA
jgi:transposase